MTQREFNAIRAQVIDRKRRTVFAGTAHPGDVRGVEIAPRTRRSVR